MGVGLVTEPANMVTEPANVVTDQYFLPGHGFSPNTLDKVGLPDDQGVAMLIKSTIQPTLQTSKQKKGCDISVRTFWWNRLYCLQDLDGICQVQKLV